jgi:hypothetical protein
MMLPSFAAALHCLLSSLALMLSWGGVFYGSRCLVSRMLPHERISTQYCAMGVVAIAFVVLTLELLGAFNLLSAVPLALACLAFACVAGRLCRRHGEGDFAICIRWLNDRIRDGYGILFCVVTVLVFQAVARALRCPPLSHDSLTYHAFFPAQWIQRGGFVPFAAPGAMDGYSAVPMNLELLVAFVAMPFANDLLINLVNLPILLLTGIAVYDLAREMGASARLAVWGPVVFCFAPAVWGQATTQYNDILLAGLMGIGVLFLIRFLKANHSAALMICAGAMGLACGVRYTALPPTLLVLAIVTLRLLRRSGRRRQACVLLLSCCVIGFLCGGPAYVRNWVAEGNPVYPFEVKVGGTVVFEGSPMQADVLENTPRGERADDWRVFCLIFSVGKYVWGPLFAVVMLMAGWSAIGGSPDHRFRLLLTLFWVLFLAAFFLPNDGIAERTRHMFSESSLRMLGFSMLVVTALAVAAADRLPWPKGLVSIVPTFVTLADVWQGSFPQPPSAAEIAVVVSAVFACLWCFASDTAVRSLIRIVSSSRSRAVLTAILLLVASVVTPVLVQKRNRTRYYHFEHSYDYHPISRQWVSASRICDEPGNPHVVALARPHLGLGDKTILRAVLHWFFYPLLGSDWQNRVVYASVHEERDIPSVEFRGGLSLRFDNRAWISNLDRLGVDRLVVAAGTFPEQEWVRTRPGVFRLIHADENYEVYALDRDALKLALAGMVFEPAAALPEGEGRGLLEQTAAPLAGSEGSGMR